MLNGQNPLWMPTGSVRAIMALALVGATIASAFVMPEIAVGLLTLTTIVIKDYFRARENGM